MKISRRRIDSKCVKLKEKKKRLQFWKYRIRRYSMLINSYIFYSLCFFPLSDPRISRFFAILFFIDHITPYKKILRNFPSRIKSLQHDRLIVAYLFFLFFSYNLASYAQLNRLYVRFLNAMQWNLNGSSSRYAGGNCNSADKSRYETSYRAGVARLPLP